MTERQSGFPPHYSTTVRVLLRYALIMLMVGLLSGVAYRESAKKLPLTPAPDGPQFWDGALHLALVHGHLILIGVLLPVALAGMLHLARAHGGRELGPRSLAWVVYLYLPCATVTGLLMLYKGYHVLLAARHGEADLARIDETFFAGNTALRYAIYGLSHTGMAVGLGIFAWCLWRSLGTRRATA